MEQDEIDRFGRMIAEGSQRISAGTGRPVDWEKVRTRTVAFTDDQMLLKQIVDRSLPDICADAETGIALVSYMLSELILRTARPGMVPEAVATAVRVLQFNCGVAEPVRPGPTGNAEIAALMLDGHAINCQCDACIRAVARGNS